MKVKTVGSAVVEVKAGGPLGQARAIFSRFGLVDHDGDVTVPGAIEDGAQVVVSAYQHQSWKGVLPVGRAVIHTDAEKAWADVQFNMMTQAGRDTFEVVRDIAELGQWSYGFDILESDWGSAPDGSGRQVQFLRKLKVHEVSPVLVGAGIETHTESTKSDLQKEMQREYERFLAFDAPDELKARQTATTEWLHYLRSTLANNTMEGVR